MGRNTAILGDIITLLASQLPDKAGALDMLEQYFQHQCLVNAGDVEYFASSAQHLRLNITRDECSMVLDHIAANAMVGTTVDHVEQAVDALFGNRFIEPEK